MRVRVDKRIKDIIARDKAVMLKTTKERYPFVADHGSGDHVYDVSGNKFIDFSSFISVYNLGINANSEVREAVKEQVDLLMHPAFTDFYAERPVRFAEKLVKMFPKGFGKVFFSNSGTEANEDAIKLSRIFTKRQYLLSFYNSFHGRTAGSLALTASKSIQRKHYGPFPGVIHAPYPYPYRCPFGTEDPDECGQASLDYLKKNILDKEASPDEIAAIFFEPVQGEGGYIIPPQNFIKGLREMCDDYGMLLVADEVQTGYMRTGSFLALEHFGVDADIYTMAKSTAGGIPFGVTVSRSSLGDVQEGEHANTFGGNLLAIAAAEASLDYINRNFRSLRSGINSRSSIVMRRLLEMQEKYGIIGEIRGIGLMIGIELVKDRKTREPAEKERSAVLEECFYNGLILLPAGRSTIRVIPPLTISIASLEEGLDILENALQKHSKRSKAR